MTLTAQLKNEAVTIINDVSIRMMWKEENLYYGMFLSEITKDANYKISTIQIEARIDGIWLLFNPEFIVRTMHSAGEDVLVTHLKIQLNHLLLMHLSIQDNLKDIFTSKGVPQEVLTFVLRNIAFRAVGNNANEKIPCSNCVTTEWDKQHEFNNVAFDVCPVCHGEGHMFNSAKLLKESDPEYSLTAQNRWAKGDPLKILEDIKSGAIPKSDVDIVVDYAINNNLSIPKAQEGLQPGIVQSLVTSSIQHILNKGASPDSGLLSAFKEAYTPKAEPYINKLKGSISAKMGTHKMNTRYRPNRRFGFLYPGKRTRPKMKYVVAVDTSGSVSAEDVAKSIAEFEALKQYAHEVEVRVILFHSSVWADFSFEDFSMKEFSKKYQSGGTDFDAVFKYVFEGGEVDTKKDNLLNFSTQQSTVEKNCVVVMITDGYCNINYDKTKISGHIIWVLTEDGSKSYISDWNPESEIIEMN